MGTFSFFSAAFYYNWNHVGIPTWNVFQLEGSCNIRLAQERSIIMLNITFIRRAIII